VATETSDLITDEIPDNTTKKPDQNNEWYSVTFSYNQDVDITELQSLYDKLIECCVWSKAAYHSCPDISKNENPHDCSIDESDMYRDGDIPEYVPSLN
jgi:hypothetical protein